MKRFCSIILVFLVLLPSSTWANGIIGPENPNKSISRAEMATVATRLLGLEGLRDDYDKAGKFKDVDGWALPFVNIASEKKVMMGTSSDSFNPEGHLTYVEVLTVLMRILGYEDGIDFQSYPKDYYKKALEIGLADLYIDSQEEMTRSISSDTIDRALELNMKNTDIKLREELRLAGTSSNAGKAPTSTPSGEIGMEDLKFNSSIAGVFSGRLEGLDDFTGYKLELLSGDGQVYGTEVLDKSGDFKITGFDVGTIAKLYGYMYKVFDAQGDVVLSSDLK